MPERELVERASPRSRNFSVFAFDNFFVPQFGQLGWVVDLAPFAEADADYDLDDLIPSVRSSDDLRPIEEALSLDHELSTPCSVHQRPRNLSLIHI